MYDLAHYLFSCELKLDALPSNAIVIIICFRFFHGNREGITIPTINNLGYPLLFNYATLSGKYYIKRNLHNLETTNEVLSIFISGA